MPSRLVIQEEVADALRQERPVVALESTVIAHGLPRPDNLECARKLETIVRQGGAVPATIALLDGAIRIGLTPDQIERIALETSVAKVSRRDLAAVLASGQTGATTVAGTVACAAMAGIGLLATGGIGGVHRGGEISLDVSADLHELSRTPLAVICAGVKSVLDIGRTLELLETLGIPVVGYGTSRFPAFYVRDSGFDVPHRVDTPQQAARLIGLQRDLGANQAILLAQPVPADQELPPDEIETHIQDALRQAAEQGLTGARITPFLLERLARITGDRSLQTNLALLENNAALAAQIAAAQV
jgi:pseudouridine-5'-phosphate glycosidase